MEYINAGLIEESQANSSNSFSATSDLENFAHNVP